MNVKFKKMILLHLVNFKFITQKGFIILTLVLQAFTKLARANFMRFKHKASAIWTLGRNFTQKATIMAF